MKVTRSSRRQLQLQNLIFLVGLLIVAGLLGWLSTRYNIEADWTSSGRNSLSVDSRKLLEEMKGPVHITAFARETPELRDHIRDLIARYQRHKADIDLRFVNPDAEPERVRELGITLDGELLIAYNGRSDTIQDLSEQSLTNALLRLARPGTRKVVFLTGHGERNPQGQANHDFGQFGKLLVDKGLNIETLTLAETQVIPEDTSLLVIADPRTPLLSGEVKLINRYLKQGGNLLWLIEPGSLHGLEPVAETLGIELLPGTVVDATTQLFGIDNPAFAVIPDYPMHEITRSLEGNITLFPQACAIDVTTPEGWQAEPLLTTLDRAWTEIGPISGTIRFDQDSDERMGPLDIGYVFTREQGDEDRAIQQRVVTICDSDFISNTYLGNAGNINLGLALFNWLNHDDRFIAITARTASDVNLELSKLAQALIGFGFLFLLPLALLSAGVGIWWRRRNR
ncbi:Gliding motility-associated ABC transporter substrate-binding protein GldG [hydrothermal vent metagenome]|uniref:Gliding motility-associated ABC transporter substrate-binding protein GldG n=1 Tax=hydrothermal vent metagenome TaxID=652676 RepID=A0A3B0ZBH9_9ZZZZ